ncbi:hypothetical protein ABK040_008264 [Willaertia magna]
MITPNFTCSQTDEFVIVCIQVPHVKMSEMEYSIDNNTEQEMIELNTETKSLFRFYVKPYFLRLHFAQELNQDGTLDYSKYDPENEKIYIYLPKRNRGEFFENLDMITWLLGGRTTNVLNIEPNTTSDSNNTVKKEEHEIKKKAPLIEVIDSTENNDNMMNDEEEGNNEMKKREQLDFDWKQTIPGTNTIDINNNNLLIENDMQEDNEMLSATKLGIEKVYYGFNRQFNGIFSNFSQDYVNEIINLPTNPEFTPQTDRRRLRIEEEIELFDPEHFLVDYVNKERELKPIFEYLPNWYNEQENVIEWNEKEQNMLKDLSRKEFLIGNQEMIYYGLVDLLCSYCYCNRSFIGETNVESVWTICKMSSQLSYLDEFNNLKETLESFISRVCVFALYRNFDLSLLCIQDLCKLLRKGKAYVLRALLDMKYILAHTHDKYLLNKIYIDNYCIWIQGISNEMLERLANAIEQIVKEEFILKRDSFTISNLISLQKLEDYAKECLRESNNNVEDLILTEQDHEKPLAI